ncbi:MAG TPA: hypothetical protein VK158_01195, partial [Acidobacteriota bacterium]|nr:hypothetical protein [Acidobacteriota bacterium]
MTTNKVIGIRGSGCYFPKEKVDVESIAKKYNLDFTKLLSNQGVLTVHLASATETELYMSIKAAQEAIEDSKLKAQQIDLVIYCRGLTKTQYSRSVSSQIIEKLNIKNAYGFDLEGGLLGGLLSIRVATDILRNSFQVKNALIVAAQEFDQLYLFNEAKSRVGNMVFGDGAAAIVISKDISNNTILSSDFVIDHYTNYIDEALSRNKREPGLVSSVLTFTKMDTFLDSKNFEKLTDRWVMNTIKVIESCIKSINLDVSDINHFVKTQLSKKETQIIAEKLKINTETIYTTTQHCGHLGHVDI